MVCVAWDAANQLAAEGIGAEVINVRFIKPIDTATIFGSASETGLLVTLGRMPAKVGFGSNGS